MQQAAVSGGGNLVDADANYDSSTGWTLSSTASIGSSNLNFAGNGVTVPTASANLKTAQVANDFFKVTYVITSVTAGAVQLVFNGGISNSIRSASGTYIEYVKLNLSGIPTVGFKGLTSSAVASIKSILVEGPVSYTLGAEIISDVSFNVPSAWTVTTGTAVTGGQGVFTAAASGRTISNTVPNEAIVAERWYETNYEIATYVSGTVRGRVGLGQTPLAGGAVGTFNGQMKATSASVPAILVSTTATLAVDNFSAKRLLFAF